MTPHWQGSSLVWVTRPLPLHKAGYNIIKCSTLQPRERWSTIQSQSQYFFYLLPTFRVAESLSDTGSYDVGLVRLRVYRQWESSLPGTLADPPPPYYNSPFQSSNHCIS